MNENKNGIICTIDDTKKCVRIDQVADCGNEQCEMITTMIVKFSNGNLRMVSAQLFFDEPLPLCVSEDRLKQEVSKLVIAHYGNEYKWINVDSFDVMSDTDVWHIGQRLLCLMLMFFASLATFALTETVDGVTWEYYIENDYAVLGRETGGCAHTGILPDRLELPTVLGGVPARAIAAGAIEVGSDVDMLVIPASYTNMASVSLCSGHYVYVNSYKELKIGCHPIGSNTEIFFKGNRPSIHLPSTFKGSSGQEITYSYSNGESVERRTKIVEGTDGWPTVGLYLHSFPWNGFLGGGDCEYAAAKVEIAPMEKVFSGVPSVSLSCTNKTAKVYYTLDGSDPTTNQTENCFLYENPFIISHRTQVKALAYVAEYPYQVIYSNEYAFGQMPTPTMTATEGIVFNWPGNMVTLSCETEGAEIRYTLDGSEPTESSRLYTWPFTIDDTTTVKAKAFKEDWFESATATATFTREWYTVDAPVIEPSGAEFENVSQTVSLSCATEGATILYTTDGSDPKVNGREYTKPFTIYKTCTVRAIAVKYDWKDSAEATATFTRGESLSEAANLYGYTMETDSAAPWTVDAAVSHDGVSSVRSGAIGNNGTTYLMASVKKAGTVSFWWKAQCEEPDEEDGEDGYYDYGAFLVDNVVVARVAGHDGEWHYVSHEVASGGKHTLKWEYCKEGVTSYAPDCIWVDQVQWIPADGSGSTLTTPEAVPYSWLSRYGLGAGTDFETAASALSGKVQSGKATRVWEEWVAGTDPTNVTSRFVAKIEMCNGEPVVTWEPDLNTNGIQRIYKVYGKENLTDAAWAYPTNSLHRFFKVTVEMP